MTSLVLQRYDEWASRVADTVDAFGIPGEMAALRRDREALREEIDALRAESAREDYAVNWRLRRYLRRAVQREYLSKMNALDSYAAFLMNEGIEELEESTREERRRALMEAGA